MGWFVPRVQLIEEELAKSKQHQRKHDFQATLQSQVVEQQRLKAEQDAKVQ